MAAVDVLEAAGYHVTIPRKRLCCGRPLYDWGFLDTAKHLLRETIDALQPELDEGIAIIGLEPSCVSVFRDELHGLFPGDEDAQRLQRQTFLLSEFLVDRRWKPPPLDRKAIVHGHCHHKAVLGWKKEVELLKQVLPDHEVIDSGCCGMAGSFGYEADKYDVSMRIGERRLLPRVREVDDETLIVSDGFSCHGQISTTGKRPLHIAQALQ